MDLDVDPLDRAPPHRRFRRRRRLVAAAAPGSAPPLVVALVLAATAATPTGPFSPAAAAAEGRRGPGLDYARSSEEPVRAAGGVKKDYSLFLDTSLKRSKIHNTMLSQQNTRRLKNEDL